MVGKDVLIQEIRKVQILFLKYHKVLKFNQGLHLIHRLSPKNKTYELPGCAHEFFKKLDNVSIHARYDTW